MENQKRAYGARYLLLRSRQSNENSNRGFYDLQKYVLRKLKARSDANKKEEIVEILTEVNKFLLSLNFLKRKSRSRYFKKHQKDLKIELRNG
jgi:hypothetical protein